MKNKNVLALCFFCIQPAWATLSVASRTDGFSGAVVTTISATKHSNTTGNLLVVFLSVQSGNADSAFTMGDTAGNTFTEVGSNVVQGSNRLRIFESFNITGNANDVVSSTWTSSTGSYHYIDVYEINSTNGNFTSDPFIAISSATGNSTSLDSGNITPVGASAIIVAGMEADGGSITAGTNYTLVTDAGAGGSGFAAGEYHIVSAAEHATATATTGLWGIIGAAFNEPAAAATVYPVPFAIRGK